MKEKYVLDTIRLELSRDLLALVNSSAGEPTLLDSICGFRDETQKEAIHRRKIMRKARSKKKLKPLLQDLEAQYAADG